MLDTKDFSYETISQKEYIAPLLGNIHERIESTLIYAYLNGRDLCEIRIILGGQFNKWLKSDEWVYSDRLAYNYITFFENCDRNGLDEEGIKNIKVGLTKVLNLLSKNKYEIGKQLLTSAKEGKEITPQFIVELEANTPREVETRNFTYNEAPKTGCRNCKHYTEANGREKCLFYDEFLRNLRKEFDIEPKKGCDRIIEITPTEKEDLSQVGLSQKCWTKVLFEASKKGKQPESFIEETLLVGLEEKDRLEIRVQELEQRLQALEFERNEMLLKLKKAEERGIIL